jgi:hypothetical protein
VPQAIGSEFKPWSWKKKIKICSVKENKNEKISHRLKENSHKTYIW